VISFQIYFPFLSIDDTVDKFETAKSVTSAYQEIVGINISGRK